MQKRPMSCGQSKPVPLSVRGRGAASNPANRFEKLDIIPDGDALDADALDADAPRAALATIYLKDTTRSIIATNDSPDVGFDASINPYRGCEHGCIYCYARPFHEYLGFSCGLDFETKILVKMDAPRLLHRELSWPQWQPRPLQMSGVTDCYQPIERKLQLTRQCLAVLAEFRNPVTIVTKNALVQRDLDLLQELAAHHAAIVLFSITTLDADLARVMEPRTAVPRRRLEAMGQLAAAGIPVGVMAAPIIPGLNDHEIPAILRAAADAGAAWAGYEPLRLPHAVATLFVDWLSLHFPDRKEKILGRIRAMRNGKLNDPNFGSRMRGSGLWAEQLKLMFHLAKRKAGLDRPYPSLSVAAFRRPPQPQLTLW
jgi:DNA repair photolyase